MSVLGTVALGVSMIASGCGGGGGASTVSDVADAGKQDLVGTPADPIRPAPRLKLDNSLGQPVNLAEYRGKAVFITWIYVNCPDICPLIVSNMRVAQNELGSDAGDVQFIAVSVDPENDTPQVVNRFLKERQMTGRMEYLVGTRPQLERTWARWDIVSRNDPSRKIPDEVEHSSLVYGISADGEVTTLYPANFKPQWLVHDAPILAAQ
jgi:protein SCO1/2